MGNCFPSADMVTLGGHVKVKVQVKPKYFFLNFFKLTPSMCVPSLKSLAQVKLKQNWTQPGSLYCKV